MNKNLIYKGYQTNIQFDKEDNIYYGKIENIHDMVNFHGNTLEEVKKEFEIAVEDYLVFCNEIGKIPEIPSKKIYIETNKSKERAISFEKELKEFLIKEKQTIVTTPEDSDFIISLGGDGTFIETANKYRKINKPIFGINCGTLGYLTEGTIENYQEKLKKIFHNKFAEENRLVLDCFVKDNFFKNALNDVVLLRNDKYIIRFEIYVNDEFLTKFSADGIIVSTPTGATGYALSCGGAFIDSASEMIELTAISPHTLVNRSIVLDKNSVIKIVMKHGVGILTCDNQEYSKKIINETEIIIQTSEEITKVIKVDNESFIERISRVFNEFKNEYKKEP